MQFKSHAHIQCPPFALYFALTPVILPKDVFLQPTVAQTLICCLPRVSRFAIARVLREKLTLEMCKAEKKDKRRCNANVVEMPKRCNAKINVCIAAKV